MMPVTSLVASSEGDSGNQTRKGEGERAVIAESAARDVVLDHLAITDPFYRYASVTDRFDYEDGVRSVLADDIVAQYGNAEPLHGPDAVIGFFNEATAGCVMQHQTANLEELGGRGPQNPSRPGS
jgi:hypothetical protein